ncbi:MAG TPA: permease prefix domain 1-containing protein [Dehalococcoidia bacterium]
MKTIDAYLNTLCWSMGGSLAQQQSVRDELRAHIEAAMRDFELEGMATRTAIATALDDLGEPEALGRELRASRGTPALRRPLFQPAGAVLVERAHVHALPDARLALALFASSMMAAFVILIYAWPG